MKTYQKHPLPFCAVAHLRSIKNFSIFRKKGLHFAKTYAIISRLVVKQVYAPVAQLDRVTDYESVGRGFESLPAYQKSRYPSGYLLFCILRRKGLESKVQQSGRLSQQPVQTLVASLIPKSLPAYPACLKPSPLGEGFSPTCTDGAKKPDGAIHPAFQSLSILCVFGQRNQHKNRNQQKQNNKIHCISSLFSVKTAIHYPASAI